MKEFVGDEVELQGKRVITERFNTPFLLVVRTRRWMGVSSTQDIAEVV